MFKKVLEDLQFKKNIAETSRLFKEDPKNSKIFRNLSKGSRKFQCVICPAKISVHKLTPRNKERKERKKTHNFKVSISKQFLRLFTQFLFDL